jgi:hypothetical protein
MGRLGGRHGAGTSSQKQFIILVSFTSVAISAQVFPPPLAYMAPKPKRASGLYKPGSRTRASGDKDKSNVDPEPPDLRFSRKRLAQITCHPAEGQWQDMMGVSKKSKQLRKGFEHQELKRMRELEVESMLSIRVADMEDMAADRAADTVADVPPPKFQTGQSVLHWWSNWILQQSRTKAIPSKQAEPTTHTLLRNDSIHFTVS